ncbi:olfactory receptor 554 (predicted) [Rattus norvegicus]|uniref:Olfactory receptor n=2 Tax=Rattus norvegicus TaxID=10116 RepID=M0RBX0_RAT|nr:olfactory receptor Olr554 [Rattus norvegicus]EDL79389.1 olfactory receptor 554 (predicted) [Rattus norvegicus]|eukprot:NP_001000323.1 olfactory receptor Olr554 [Rattus norvegicus]
MDPLYSLQQNHSTLVEFILLGFSDVPNLQEFLFWVFLIIYVIILMGNSLIIIITKVDLSLRTPMYFFLSNFSFLEMCYVSVTLPRLLTDLYRQHRIISFMACATQMYFFLVFGATECFILTAMAYDRYVAICNPLLYPLIMNNSLCIQLAAGCWISGVPVHIGFTYWIFSLPFCGSNQLNHFFCDIPPVLTLACGDTFMIEMLIYVIALLVVTIPFMLILGSYVKIISNILKLPSAIGRAKAFSTCSSHVIVVALFFGSGIITYLRPKSSHSAGLDKFLSLFYTVVTPMFNPMIYCLRNKDVMIALKKFLLRWLML